MSKRSFNIWVVNAILSLATTLPARKLTASPTGSVSRSNIALEHVYLILVRNHPTSVISGAVDRGDGNGKLSRLRTIKQRVSSVFQACLLICIHNQQLTH